MGEARRSSSGATETNVFNAEEWKTADITQLYSSATLLLRMAYTNSDISHLCGVHGIIYPWTHNIVILG